MQGIPAPEKAGQCTQVVEWTPLDQKTAGLVNGKNTVEKYLLNWCMEMTKITLKQRNYLTSPDFCPKNELYTTSKILQKTHIREIFVLGLTSLVEQDSN